MAVNGLKKRTKPIIPEPEPEEEEEYIEISYRDGAEGMIAWCEDKVRLPIYPSDSEIAIWWPMGDMPEEKNPKTG